MKGNWIDLVRLVVPASVTDDECIELLWAATPFPFGRPSQVLHSLREYWKRGEGTVNGTICAAEEELDRVTEEHHQETQS